MDSKRTPKYTKPIEGGPKSTGSRSHQKRDVNCTLPGSVGFSRCLNQTLRQPSNTTLSDARCSAVKRSIGPSGGDELKCDLAYNNYLQALMKQEIVTKIIEEQEIKLNDQILIQSEHFHKLGNTFQEIHNKIKNLQEQSDVVKLLQMLKYSVDQIESISATYNAYDRLRELKNILTEESNCVSVKNIKPINSQEEYDKLISTLENLKCVMQNILKAHKKVEEVNQLAHQINAFKELNCTITEAVHQLNSSNKKAAESAIKQASDFFAQQGGYF